MEERRNQQNRQPQQSQSGTRQHGGQPDARQQQQFDQQPGQQSGGSGTTNRFASQIRERMEVIDGNGQHCGTVDHLDGDRIKLARSDSTDGQHHYVALSQVAGIEGNKVRLRERMETRGVLRERSAVSSDPGSAWAACGRPEIAR
jgi:hypothetical protein